MASPHPHRTQLQLSGSSTRPLAHPQPHAATPTVVLTGGSWRAAPSMGPILEGIKRRLLGTSRSQRGLEAPQPAPPPLQPPAPDAPRRNPGAAALPSPTPRRVALGGLGQQLDALQRLQQQFAELLQHHQSATKALGRDGLARLAARWPLPEDAAAPAAASQPAQPDAKALRRPGKAKQRARARKEPWVDTWLPPAGEEAAAAAPGAATEPGAAPLEAEASAFAASPAPAAARQAKLAQLKQRQARRSAEGSPGAGGRLLGAEASEGPLLLQEAGSQWAGAHWRRSSEGSDAQGLRSAQPDLADQLTPQVLAAAAQRSRPPSQQASEASWRSNAPRSSMLGSSRRTTMRSSSQGSDLGLPPADWGALAPAPAGGEQARTPPPVPVASGRSSQQEGAVELDAGSHTLRPDAQPPASTARPSLLLPRLSGGGVSPDVLSLRESAALVRRGSHAGRPPLPPKRRAQSVQESEAAEAGGSLAVLPLADEAGTAAASSPAAELSDGARRLAALRRRRQPGWQSDFGVAVPGWRYSPVRRPCRGGGLGHSLPAVISMS